MVGVTRVGDGGAFSPRPAAEEGGGACGGGTAGRAAHACPRGAGGEAEGLILCRRAEGRSRRRRSSNRGGLTPFFFGNPEGTQIASGRRSGSRHRRCRPVPPPVGGRNRAAAAAAPAGNRGGFPGSLRREVGVFRCGRWQGRRAQAGAGGRPVLAVHPCPRNGCGCHPINSCDMHLRGAAALVFLSRSCGFLAFLGLARSCNTRDTRRVQAGENRAAGPSTARVLTFV